MYVNFAPSLRKSDKSDKSDKSGFQNEK